MHDIFYYMSRQDSLSMEASPDEIAGEQTWPSEMEMGYDTNVNSIRRIFNFTYIHT